MKKLLTIMVLALALCLLCSAAMAGGTDYELPDDLFGAPVVTVVDGKAVSAKVTIAAGKTVKVDGVDRKTLAGTIIVPFEKHGEMVEIQLDFADSTHKIVFANVWPHDELGTVTENPKATCTEDGVFNIKCSCKGCTYITKKVAEKHHFFAEKILKPNCEADGEAVEICTKCGAEGKTYVLAEADHVWKQVKVAPHCQKGKPFNYVVEGYTTWQCEKCGKYAPNNAVAKGDATIKATLEDSVKNKYTTVGAWNAAVDPADQIKDGHTWDGWIYVAPTCEKAGYRYHWCHVCDNNVEEDFTGKSEAQLQHDLGDDYKEEYKDWGKKLKAQWTLVIANGNTIIDCQMVHGVDYYFVCSACNGKVENHTTKGATTGVTITANTSLAIYKVKVKLNAPFDDFEETYQATHKYDESADYVVKTADNKTEIPATCTGRPYKVYKCIADKDNTVKITEKAAVVAKNGAYTLAGYTHPVKVEYTGNALDHKLGKWEEIEKPNLQLNKKGRYVRYCERDGCTYYEERHEFERPVDICQDGKHDFSVAITPLPKCGETIDVTYQCSKCDVTKVVKDVEGLHEYPETPTAIKKAATCTEAGVALFVCPKCNTAIEKPIDKLDHKLTLTAEKPATCGEAGKKAFYTCSECGKFFADAKGETEVKEADLVIPQLTEHDWKNAIEEIVKEPTCTEKGKKLLTCPVCKKATKTEEIDMIAHTPVEIPAVEPTCKTPGATAGEKCSVCETVLKAPVEIPVDLTKHVWGEVIVSKAPTCEVAGVGVKVCSICKTSEEVVISAKGHDWGEWEVTTPATLEKDGEATRVCKNDPTHKETKPVKYEATDPAKYEVKVDYSKPKATGTVELDPHTKALTKAYARVTFFLANGDCMIQIVEVKDGKFTAGAEGNFTHVSVIIVDDAEAYGAEEAIEHAHGNGGIEL